VSADALIFVASPHGSRMSLEVARRGKSKKSLPFHFD